MKTSHLLLLTLTVFIACDNSVEDYTGSDIKLRKVINESNEVVESYNYYASGLIRSYTKKNLQFSTSNEQMNYQYNSEGQLSQKSGHIPGNMIMSSIQGAMDRELTANYNYNAEGYLQKIELSYDYGENEDISYSTTNTYSYLGDTSIVLSVTNDKAPTNNENIIEYRLNDEGNIVRQTQYFFDENDNKIISTIMEFEYDNKHNPYQFEPILTSTNNVTRKTVYYYYYDYGSFEVESINQSEYTYEYTYDNNDYPISMTETWPNETVHIRYYRYK